MKLHCAHSSDTILHDITLMKLPKLLPSLIAEYEASTTYFVHSDHLGSTRLLTNLSQGVYDSMDYDPFGRQTLGATPGRATNSPAKNGMRRPG